MKRKAVKLLSVVIFAIGICGYYHAVKTEQTMNELALKNVEALAQGEWSNHLCYGKGDIEYDGMKVKYRIDGLNLE